MHTRGESRSPALGRKDRVHAQLGCRIQTDGLVASLGAGHSCRHAWLIIYYVANHQSPHNELWWIVKLILNRETIATAQLQQRPQLTVHWVWALQTFLPEIMLSHQRHGSLRIDLVQLFCLQQSKNKFCLCVWLCIARRFISWLLSSLGQAFCVNKLGTRAPKGVSTNADLLSTPAPPLDRFHHYSHNIDLEALLFSRPWWVSTLIAGTALFHPPTEPGTRS